MEAWPVIVIEEIPIAICWRHQVDDERDRLQYPLIPQIKNRSPTLKYKTAVITEAGGEPAKIGHIRFGRGSICQLDVGDVVLLNDHLGRSREAPVAPKCRALWFQDAKARHVGGIA